MTREEYATLVRLNEELDYVLGDFWAAFAERKGFSLMKYRRNFEELFDTAVLMFYKTPHNRIPVSVEIPFETLFGSRQGWTAFIDSVAVPAAD